MTLSPTIDTTTRTKNRVAETAMPTIAPMLSADDVAPEGLDVINSIVGDVEGDGVTQGR